MKLTIKIITIFLFLTSSVFSQWDEKNIQTANTLTAVSFFDNDTGYVSSLNSIYKTTDGGENWESSYSSSGNTFIEDVFVIDQENIIAVGRNTDLDVAVVIKSDNEGSSWNESQISSSAFINSVFFLDNENGFCCSSNGQIFKSTNGGDSWQLQDSGTSISLQSIFFVDENIGFSVGGSPLYSIILKTTNGGNTWNEVASPSDNNLQSVYFISDQVGYIVGWNGEILKTENCGSNWIQQSSVAMSGNLQVLFTDFNTGYIVGGDINEALIQKTSNGGDNWFEVGPDIPDGLVSINFPGINTGYAVGANGTVLKTTSGGEITSVVFIDRNLNINIYPNPTSQYLNIQTSDENVIKRIGFFDLQGNRVRSKFINTNEIQLDISNLESGHYYIQLNFESYVSMTKFLKI